MNITINIFLIIIIIKHLYSAINPQMFRGASQQNKSKKNTKREIEKMEVQTNNSKKTANETA